MSREHDERLEAALDGLPDVTASAGFTERVGRALERRGRRPATRRWRLAAATLALAAATGAFAWRYEQRARAADAARDIRRQHLELQRELAELRALARESEPLLYLGGDESYDLVADLGPLLELRPGGTVLPATYTTPPAKDTE